MEGLLGTPGMYRDYAGLWVGFSWILRIMFDMPSPKRLLRVLELRSLRDVD